MGSRWMLAALAAVGVLLAAVPTVVAATSSTVTSVASVVYGGAGVLMVWAAGLLLWTRPRDRRMAWLLLALAVAYAVRALGASDQPWVYSVARLLTPASEFVVVWALIAFPSGYVRTRHDRLILAAAGLTVTVLWAPVVLLVPDIPMPTVLTPCTDDCPQNMLMLADRPELADALLTAYQVAAVCVVLAAASSVGHHLVRASPLTRRTLAPVFVAAIGRLLVVALWLGSSPSGTLFWPRLASFWAIPISIVVGLLIGRLYTASALQRLVSGMQRRPDAEQLEGVMSEALRDPGLRIVYWLPDLGRWSDHGQLLDGAVQPAHGQAVTPLLQEDGQTIAAVVHDEALLEQAELIEAAIASARLALETNRLQAALAAFDADLAEAPSRARRELERDLHDGAQQRLIALRMKVSVVSRLFDQDPRRAAQLAQELGPDIDAALAELRDLAHGRGVPRLEVGGLPAALADLAARAPLHVTLSTDGVGRYPPSVESAVYYICSEALQNAAKHAGDSARADVQLTDEGSWLALMVADDGPANPVDLAGAGVRNMQQRAQAVGGELVVGPGSPCGTVVTTRIPHAGVAPAG